MFWLYLIARRLRPNQFRPIYGEFAYVDYPFALRSRTYWTVRLRLRERAGQLPGTYG